MVEVIADEEDEAKPKRQRELHKTPSDDLVIPAINRNLPWVSAEGMTTPDDDGAGHSTTVPFYNSFFLLLALAPPLGATRRLGRAGSFAGRRSLGRALVSTTRGRRPGIAANRLEQFGVGGGDFGQVAPLDLALPPRALHHVLDHVHKEENSPQIRRHWKYDQNYGIHVILKFSNST